jgi:alkylhydroperoxidase family enzyme
VLTRLLEQDAVPMEVLSVRYGALLELVRKLLGVVPNCDPYLEIWPPAFRAYNVMVPNLLNLPFMLWGVGAPRASVGLAMYVSSRTAGCMYCSAHCCTFALRSGATVEEVASALAERSDLSEANRAAVRVAHAMASVPPCVDDDVRAALLRHFSASDAEWIVLSVAMMGWLNKTMDALGVPLETPTVAEVTSVISPAGWTPGRHLTGDVPAVKPPGADSLFARLSLIRYAPRAISLDKRWTRNVPDRSPDVGRYLEEQIGYSFSVLSSLHNRRAVRAIATMIRDTLAGETVIGRDQKLAAGLIFAQTVQSETLEAELRALGATEMPDSPALTLTRAISPSPAQVHAETVESARAIEPAGIVETVSTVALFQLLHRLSTFYEPTVG